MNASVVWAVAGARKTQQIVDHCAANPSARLRLALTFTTTGQEELKRRTAACPQEYRPEVMGWYTFLIKQWVRPYLWELFPGRKVTGFNFEGEPPRFAKGAIAYFDSDGRIYRRNLARLAFTLNSASGGLAVQRLRAIYSEILIDEIQDLNGWDLEIINALLESEIDLLMVGDTRQCVYSTNPQDQKNKQFKGMAVSDWFDEAKRSRSISVSHSSKTFRSIQSVADFADTIFPSSYKFPPTISSQRETHSHMGMWAVAPTDAVAYVEEFQPLVLSWDKKARASLPSPCRNMGEVKGLTAQHVLIMPTGQILKFLKTGAPLPETSACKLYVAVTRAVFSVAFIHDGPLPGLRAWAVET